MRKTRYLILGALVLSLGAAPALIYAGWEGGPDGGGGHWRHGGPGGPMMGGPGMFLHVVLKKLNLNATQQQAVDQIMATHRATFQSLFQQTHTLQKSLDAKFFSDAPPTATDPDVVALQSLRGKLMNEGLATALDIRTYLVDQNLWPQAVQLWQKMQTMREEMHNFFGEPQ